ncbi:hypothetical protein BDN72DRAFT_837423 [Pluteus cervinus]|uniref:Uncharacterized protein n=1 Tax=Pluteus cervinus TaxID=181527 RepID=A0ACD3B0N1_9AGAR|nr:hypothetical protein BDN72DRAFT_837423 [Pluteus cervinus]
MSSPSISPRPILKRTTTSHPTSHGVHFPPVQALTSTYSVYSAAAYDRSPIVVAPNSCTLPERGCPGRTYTLDDPGAPTPSNPRQPQRRNHGKVLHPRALANAKAYGVDVSCYNPPPLIPDISSSSSESDESDSFAPLDFTPSSNSNTRHIHGLTIHESYTSIGAYDATGAAVTPLSFLPYSPQYTTPLDGSIPKPKRRTERKHESSTDPDRIRRSKDTQHSLALPSKSSKLRTCKQYKAMTASFSGFAMNDDGCLGGF